MIRGRARAIEHSATWGECVSKVPKRHAAEFQSNASLRIATQNSEVLVADATHNAYKAHQSLASMWLNKGACIECPGCVKVY